MPHGPSSNSRRLPLGLFLWGTALLFAGYYGWMYLDSRETEREEIVTSPSQQKLQAFEALMENGLLAIPDLIAQLQGKDVSDRRFAAIGLARLGAEAESAIPALASRFDDEDAEVRSFALLAIARINPDLGALLPDVIRRLADESKAVRTSAARLLIVYGSRGTPAVIAALQEGNLGTAEALGVLRQTAVDVAETRAALNRVRGDSRFDDDTRNVALLMLLAIGDSPIDEVGEGLSSPIYEAQRFALKQVELRKDEFPLFYPFLKGFLDGVSSDDETFPRSLGGGDWQNTRRGAPRLFIRHEILPTLGRIGVSAREASPDIERLARDETRALSERLLALTTLEQIGADRSTYAPALQNLVLEACDGRKLLPHDSPLLARTVLTLAPDQAPALLAHFGPLLESAVRDLRLQAFRLLQEFGPAAIQTFPEARIRLHTGESDERACAARLIGAIGPAAREALPDLISEFTFQAGYREPGYALADVAHAIRSVTSESTTARQAADVTPTGEHAGLPTWIVENETDRKEIVALYRQALKRPSARVIAAEELIRLGVDTDEVVRTLCDMFSRPMPALAYDEPRQILQAIHLLSCLGPRAAAAIGPLTLILESPDVNRARAAVRALRSIVVPGDDDEGRDPTRARAVQALIPYLRSTDRRVRRDAADALGAFGPSAKSALPALEDFVRESVRAEGGGRTLEDVDEGLHQFTSPIFRLALSLEGNRHEEQAAALAAARRAIERISVGNLVEETEQGPAN